MAEAPTLAEWMEEIERLGSRPDDEGFRVEELAAKTGKSATTIRAILRRAKENDMLIMGEKTINDLRGVPVRVPCYRIKKSRKKPGVRK